MAAIRPPYTATFNQYVRAELGYKTDLAYYILGGGVGRWDLGSDNGYADTSTALLARLGQEPVHEVSSSPRATTTWRRPTSRPSTPCATWGSTPRCAPTCDDLYEAGHMMYIHQTSLAQLKRDAAAFVQNAAAPRGR